MANLDIEFVDSWNRENGENDGALTFEEACVQVNEQKLNGPLRKPLRSDRPVGDITLGDLPVRNLHLTGGKFEQFADAVLNVAVDASVAFWDNRVYNLCARQSTVISHIPSDSSLNLRSHIACKSSCCLLRIHPVTSSNTSMSSNTSTCAGTNCSARSAWNLCQGCPLRFHWGGHVRVGLMALHFMQDRLDNEQTLSHVAYIKKSASP